MRWLFQQGTRWLGARVLSQAKQAAQAETHCEPAAGDALAKAHVVVAFLCESKLMFDSVADQLSAKRRLEGSQLKVCAGMLAGKPVVVARPLCASAAADSFVSAVVDGHRPRFAVSVSEATSLRDRIAPGTVVMASRVYGLAGKSLRLDGRTPTGQGIVSAGVQTLGMETAVNVFDPAEAPLAADEWSEPIARACQQAELPLMVAAIVLHPPSQQQSKETAALKRQETLAGKTGALAGMVWKKPSGLRDLWNEKQAAWEASGRLAKLAENLVLAMPDSGQSR